KNGPGKRPRVGERKRFEKNVKYCCHGIWPDQPVHRRSARIRKTSRDSQKSAQDAELSRQRFAQRTWFFLSLHPRGDRAALGEVRDLFHRYFDSAVRRPHLAALFCRPANQGSDFHASVFSSLV